LAKFTELSCNSQFALALKCEVIEDDPANPILISNAVSDTGANLLTTKTPVTPDEIAAAKKNLVDRAKGSFTGNNCSVGFNTSEASTTFRITPNTTTQRCVQGSFSVRLKIENSVTGTTGKKTSVTPQILRVNMINTCWDEARLKNGTTDFSAVANAGTAVAMNGSWAAVVAPTEDEGNQYDVGAVFMYKLENANWVFKQRIIAQGAAANDTIASVAIAGNRMVLGSPYHSGEGVAYVYTVGSNDQWSFSRVLSPSISQSGQIFGQSVAISSTRIVVGAPKYNDGVNTKSGAIYIYNLDGSIFYAQLTPNVVGGAYGTSLSIETINL
jgi:hypothetical protein